MPRIHLRTLGQVKLTPKQHKLIWILCASFVACVLEGAARKWLIPANSAVRYVAYFSKDLILATSLLVRFPPTSNALLKRFETIIYFGIAIFAIGALTGASADLNPVGAVLTIRAAVFLPLMAVYLAKRLPNCAYNYFIAATVALTIVNAPLGALQFYSPPGSIINKYTTDMDIATASYAERVRATGTFSYLAGYGIFSCVVVAAGLMKISTQTSLRQKQIGFATVAGGLVCAGATASRAVALTVLIQLAIWSIFALRKASNLFIGSGVALTILIALYFFDATETTTEIITSAAIRHSVVNDTIGQRLMQVFESIPSAVFDAPFGVGLGTQQIAGAYYATGKQGFASYEGEWPRLVMECGIFGLVGVIVTQVGSLACVVERWRNARDRSSRELYMAFGIACGTWLIGGILFNHVTSFFFWMFMTVALASAPNKTITKRAGR